MAICVECQYKNIYHGTCKNPDLPMTDFVDGVRWCNILNAKGDCKGFKPNSEPELIYKSKEDEALAYYDYRGPLLSEREHHDFRDKDEN